MKMKVLWLFGCLVVSGCSDRSTLATLDHVLKIDASTAPVTLYLGGDDSHFCALTLSAQGFDLAMRGEGYTVTNSADSDLSASCTWGGHHSLSVRPEHKTTATVKVFTSAAGARQIWLDGSFVAVGPGIDVASRLNVSTPSPINLFE